MRQYLLDSITKALPKERLAGWISSLLLGYGNLLSREHWQILQRSGTAHLMVISGLHIGLVATFIYSCSRYVWCKLFRGKLCLYLPADKFAAILATLSATLYGACTGFAIPAKRAVIMISVFMITKLFSKELSFADRFAIALLLILIIDPLAHYSNGFWLSFLAVGLLGFACKVKISPVHIHIVTNFGLLPMTWYIFGKISLVAFFANFIAVPWLSFGIMPLALLASLLAIININLSQLLFIPVIKQLAYLQTFFNKYICWILGSMATKFFFKTRNCN